MAFNARQLGMHLAEDSLLKELIMSRRLDFEKASRNHQARYGLSVKDETEWMGNDAAALWLQKNGNRALRKADHRWTRHAGRICRRDHRAAKG